MTLKFRRCLAVIALLPLLSAAAPPSVVITEAYRFGADPGRIYTLAVREGKGQASPLLVMPPTRFGLRSLDWSGFGSGQGRATIELSGPKTIWSAQRTLPGTNLDFVAASLRETQPGWLPMATSALSFDLSEFAAISPPPKDELSFAEHATAVDWDASWAKGAPPYGAMLRSALQRQMQRPRVLGYGIKPETAVIEQALVTQSPDGTGKMLLAVARMDNEAVASEQAFWSQAVFALLPKGSPYRLVPIVEPLNGNEPAERYRRRYRVVDLIDRQGNGILDVVLAVRDDHEHHLELYGWDGRGYRMLARSPGNGVPEILE